MAIAIARALLSSAVLLALAACHGAGPYGYATSYAPTGDEEKALAGARDYDPVMFARETGPARQQPVSLFGVVSSRSVSPGGQVSLTLTVRRLEPRNLCANGDDASTCRVTVTDQDFGIVHARVSLRPEDDVGERAVGNGSLVRLVGTFGDAVDPTDGAPVLRASFYRHWPRHFYVTKSSASWMRQ